MTYVPHPYAQLRAVPRSELLRWSELDVTLELPSDSEDGEDMEHEFVLFYRTAPAEHDVGIMSDYVGDWFYANDDGSIVPEEVRALDQA